MSPNAKRVTFYPLALLFLAIAIAPMVALARRCPGSTAEDYFLPAGLLPARRGVYSEWLRHMLEPSLSCGADVPQARYRFTFYGRPEGAIGRLVIAVDGMDHD